MRRILTIKLGALGDVIMATPLLSAIAREHTEDQRYVLTTTPFVRLFERFDGFEIHAVTRQGTLNLLRTVRWLRQHQFDRIYDLQGNDRTALWCALAGADERVGNHPRYPYTHHPQDRWHGQQHIFERMCEVLRSAGIDHIESRPILPATDTEKAHVTRWLADQKLASGTAVLLHAGASPTRTDKIWPFFAELGSRLEAHGLSVVWLGGDPDRARNATLARDCGVDASGEFSIPELAELGRRCRFAVTNDSGPMHVLAASDLPVFGLFGPTNWRRNCAVGQQQHVISAEGESDGPHFVPRALERLPVQQVWERLVSAGLV